jgi:phage terminase large subunit-like protein
MAKSLAEQVAALPLEQQAEIFEGYSEQDMENLNYDWGFWGRPEQSPPEGDWHIFLALAGRGWGKSRAGAEWVKKKVEENPGCKILLLGRTSSDVRDVMVSAILEAYPPETRPEYIPSKRRLEFHNGSYALCTSSESPDQLRGPQAHFAWADELAALKAIQDSSGATAWSNLLAATRLGDNPQIFGTTTPKRTPLMKQLVEDSKDPEKRIQIIRGSTFDNATLSQNYLQSIVGQYGNSDLAKQELYGEMLGDAEGLVFTQEMIDNATDNSGRVPRYPLRFITVDPSVAENPNDECGIIAMGVTQERDLTQRTAHILEDYSLKASPDIWAKVVVQACKEWNTKYVVFEKNQGGNLVAMAITALDPTIKTFPVVATKGKRTRAEPVVVVMQQGRVKFNGVMAELFDQCVFFDPEMSKYSPDRYDAFNWAVIAGMISPPPGLRAGSYSSTSAVHRRLPSGLGQGRSRINGSIRTSRR